MKKETMILAGLGAVMVLSLTEAVTTLAAETGWTSGDSVWRYVDCDGNYGASVWKTLGSGGAIYLIDDQEVIREAVPGDGESLPAISCHGEYDLR